jgi:hypothetical protein
MPISRAFTDEQLKSLIAMRQDGEEYSTIVRMLTEVYKLKTSVEAVRRAFNNYGPQFGAKRPNKTKVAAERRPIAKRIRKGKEDNSSVLVISDMHIPYHHPDAVAFLAAVKAKYKPTRIVCIGDEVDHHALSFHDSDPNLMSAGDELQAAIKALQPIYKLFPVVDIVDSNHGSMAYRKGKHHGIPRKYLRDYGDVLEAPPGWVWSHDLTITLPTGNQCYFHHSLGADVMKVVSQRGTCVVHGHHHTKFNIGYTGNPDSLLWGLMTGCLIDRYSMAFAYDNTNLGRPIVGVSIIIDGLPKLLPMTLKKGGRWNGSVP